MKGNKMTRSNESLERMVEMSKENRREPTFRLRGDWVLIRLINLGSVGRVAMPDIANEGKETRVVAVGPEVTDLKPGQRVLAFGMLGGEASEYSMFPMPQWPDLYTVRQGNVAMVVEE